MREYRNQNSNRDSGSRGGYGSSSSSNRDYGRGGSSSSRFSNSRSRPGGFRGGSRGGGGRFNRYGRGSSKSIDINRFIKKGVVLADKVEYIPKYKFHDFDINPQLKKNIEFKKYTNPTPIQDQSIPHILEGKDVLGIANTGTGKTAAFLIPLIEKIHKDRKEKVLIIVPTRELAQQINDELIGFVRSMNIYSVMCIGGSSLSAQMYNLRREFNFVIGTPGRLRDLIDRRTLELKQFTTIVLDEVDRMLDMGFIDEIKFIIRELPENRHSLFFSATLDSKIEGIINMFLKNHIKVSVRTGETAENVNQDVVRVSGSEDKVSKLEEILKKEEMEKVLIFCKTKIGVDKLDNHLYRKGFKVSSIHGDKRQSFRNKVIREFKAGRSKILIATDVAARGLDIPNVTHVINYDAPENYEDYIHRIGRTGRANNIGNALTFI